MTYTIIEADGYWVIQTNRDGEQGCGVYVCYSEEDAWTWTMETAAAILDFGFMYDAAATVDMLAAQTYRSAAPSMPKGIPASGKRAPGAGRKPLGSLALTRRNVWLSDEEAALARSLGKGNLSAGLRRALDLAYWRLD